MVRNIERYVEDALGIQLILHPWEEKKKLPIFLVDSYDFFETTLLNKPCVFMISASKAEPTPNTIRDHWEQITEKTTHLCIYASDTITSYNRKRLIQYRIPFIIPNNQIYLPYLGIHLSEHFKKSRSSVELFSPSTQLAIISTLLSQHKDKVTPSELANRLNYSPMTMTRAFNELETAGIGKLINQGKERWWIFEGSMQDLWVQTKSMLRSPVKSKEFMKILPGGKMPQIPIAGICALAETTMIYPPPLPIYAIGADEYRQTTLHKGIQLSHIDEADFLLEIWNYNPKLLAHHGKVDPFSLFLSLKDTFDERIEQALEELMEKIKW